MAPPYSKMLDSDCAKKKGKKTDIKATMSRETFQICHGVQRSWGDIHSLQVEQPIFSYLSTGSSLYQEKAEEAAI